MDNPNEPPTRRTLKLKVPSDKARLTAPRANATVAPAPRPAAGSPQSRDPTAWADAHKKKMQADMDALGSGEDPSRHGPPRR